MTTGHIPPGSTRSIYGTPQHETEPQTGSDRLGDTVPLHRLARSPDEREHDAGPDLPGAYVDARPPSSPRPDRSTERE